jgi:DNA-binding MarR family transcriptional regulator
MNEAPQRRLSLLYQAWLLTQASSRFMRLALAGTGMRGEEYGLYSYLFANGPRTLTQASRDLGQPLTTIATLANPGLESGEIVRRSHPTDRRARLLELSDAGRARVEQIIPTYSDAYATLLRQLEAREADPETIHEGIEELRMALDRTSELMTLETPAPGDTGAGSTDEAG